MMKPIYVLPIILACAVAAPFILNISGKGQSGSPTPTSLSALAPAAGLGAAVAGEAAGTGADAETGADALKDAPPAVLPAQIATNPAIPPVLESDLKDTSTVTVSSPVQDADELPPLKVTPDKPEIVHLDRDVVNVLVGSNDQLRVVPDTNRTLIVIPKKPGSTYFKALDNEGKVIMQRHVIIAAPQSKYIRIRRACADGATGCKEFSVYYCPDMCHEVSVVQDASTNSAAAPTQTPAGSSAPGADGGSPTNGAAPSAPPVMQ